MVLFWGVIGYAVGHRRLSSRDYVFKALVPFFALIALGLLGVMGHDFFSVVKDFWYFTLPITCTATGWILAEGWGMDALLPHIVGFGVCASMMVLVKAALLGLGGTAGTMDAMQWRMALASGDLASIWGILAALGLLGAGGGSRKTRRLLKVAILACLVSVIIPESRTNLLILFSALFLVFIPDYLGKRIRLYWITMAVAGVSILVVLSMGGGDPHTTIGRYQNILWEQFSFSFQDSTEANTKYRAFEALAAVNTYLSGSWLNYLFGYGFGHLIDLGMIMVLGFKGQEQEYQFIPILHNGYLFVLVKTGFIGLVIYLGFLGRSLAHFVKCRRARLRQAFWAKMGISIILAMALATLVVAGPFNKGGLFSSLMLLGMSMRCCFGDHPRPALSGRSAKAGVQFR